MRRHGRVFQPAANLKAVHARHHDVEQHDVARALLADRQRIRAVHGCEHVEIFGRQLGLEQFDVRMDVVDDENAGRHGVSLT
jgi:hypothetical protein